MSFSETHIDPHALHFIPLGGVGEIGMNASLYGTGGKWLLVDLGITFTQSGIPGVDILVPDLEFIENRKNNLLGIVLTHAHEDHLGAIPYLWPKLECPVFATSFTLTILKEKLREVGLHKIVPLCEISPSSNFKLGPFSLQYISVSHSIPESNSLVIRTKDETLLHTGDWKMDPNPMVGNPTDENAFKLIGEEGVLAMMCDSTNATLEGVSGSEKCVRQELIELISGAQQGVIVTLFASNIARLDSAAVAAKKCKRDVILLGRSLWRYATSAQANGYLNNHNRFYKGKEGLSLDPNKVLYLCTGCQGEVNAAMSKIATGNHPHCKLSQGDRVIFSSKIIPGNELAINKLHKSLLTSGVEVITDENHNNVHVSGHPRRDELKQLYNWVKPNISVPVHGELRHLKAHGELSNSLGIKQTHIISNGDILKLSPGNSSIIGSVNTGRVAIDGSRLLSPNHKDLITRKELMVNGALFISLVKDRDGILLSKPLIRSHGIFESEEDSGITNDLIDTIEEVFHAEFDSTTDQELSKIISKTLRRQIMRTYRKKPVIDVHVLNYKG